VWLQETSIDNIGNKVMNLFILANQK